jgi:serine/threonine protein kinase
VITDFGAARRLEPGKLVLYTDSEMVLTDAYTAPELLAAFSVPDHVVEYTSLVDMWSLGMTVVALIRGKVMRVVFYSIHRNSCELQDYDEDDAAWIQPPITNAKLRLFVNSHALWSDQLWDFICASDPASATQGVCVLIVSYTLLVLMSMP